MSTKFQTLDLPGRSTALKTILLSGLAAGILDATAGVIVYYIWFGFNPLQVLQFIAAGVYGPAAINGGAGMILAGLFFHFLIAYVVAAIYFYAYPTIIFLNKYKIIAGLVYGLAIWVVMNLLILPYTNLPAAPFDLGLAVTGIIWHMLLIGLPIALITAKHYASK
jgi:hypothetical protein